MEPIIDIITVYHNDKNYAQSEELALRLKEVEGDMVVYYGHDNRHNNIGFAAACNAASKLGSSPFIGFLNPDVKILYPFVYATLGAFTMPDVVITGYNFGKPPWEYQSWGCKDWVCGAALFVRRDWFESVGGFDERFVWSWEETDLIRTAQYHGKKVISLDRLPATGTIQHSSPSNDTKEDRDYKSYHFNRGARLFREKWLM